MQKRVQFVVESKAFERIVLLAIVLNAITLGLETVPSVMDRYGGILLLIDRAFLIFFTLEIVLKFSVRRFSFFNDPWNNFDFIIVAIVWFPSSGAFSVLRSLRILRALRLISGVPRLRRVVSGLLQSLPGLGAVTTRF